MTTPDVAWLAFKRDLGRTRLPSTESQACGSSPGQRPWRSIPRPDPSSTPGAHQEREGSDTQACFPRRPGWSHSKAIGTLPFESRSRLQRLTDSCSRCNCQTAAHCRSPRRSWKSCAPLLMNSPRDTLSQSCHQRSRSVPQRRPNCSGCRDRSLHDFSTRATFRRNVFREADIAGFFSQTCWPSRLNATVAGPADSALAESSRTPASRTDPA